MFPNRPVYRYSKRLLDVIGAAVALLIFAPVLAVVAWMIRRRLGSPVLFRHPRPGLHGQSFVCLKFRTMTSQRDSAGRLLPDAERLTPFGAALRRTSLDELPQLWNVLAGDMSLVGPRPLIAAYLSRYSSEQRRRHDVLPGITGWCQINGRNALSWERKFELDVWYVDHCSFWLDCRILARTVVTVLSRNGVTYDGHATCPEFLGSIQESSTK